MPIFDLADGSIATCDGRLILGFTWSVLSNGGAVDARHLATWTRSDALRGAAPISGSAPGAPEHLDPAGGRRPHRAHTSDRDCAPFLPAGVGECRGCGVVHGDPCWSCGGRGFHVPGCSEDDS